VSNDEHTPAEFELREPPELEPPMELLEEDPWTELLPRELFELVAAIGAETLLAWRPEGGRRGTLASGSTGGWRS
jgi:hypothetical protein